MTPHRLVNLALAVAVAAAIALILSTAYLLDSPSELDAIQATQDSVHDAQAAALAAAHTPLTLAAQEPRP